MHQGRGPVLLLGSFLYDLGQLMVPLCGCFSYYTVRESDQTKALGIPSGAYELRVR